MEIEPHSTLKNRTLGLYYKICIQVIKKRDKFYYVDLFASDGESICKDTDNKVWQAPFITQFLETAKKGQIDLVCYFNDLDSEKCEKLKNNLKAYDKFVKKITNEDANKVYKEFLKEIPKDEWSIFFLDPFKHSDLDFETIKSISEWSAYDERSKSTRRPELIINLMTYTMQRNARINKPNVMKAVGGGDWIDLVENKTTDEKTYEILHDSFIKNLESLGYFTTSIEIRQTPPLNSVLYYLIFASSIPQAHEIQERFKKDILVYQKKWSQQNYRLKLISKVTKQGMKPLSDYGK
ncbi:MAG: three-Cys-motif partner protein TcmP [Nanoarchaeota archaeon]|nr:three-Cys-motif partner protein TcmP [Nanoarchaeota archaeon]